MLRLSAARRSLSHQRSSHSQSVSRPNPPSPTSLAPPSTTWPPSRLTSSREESGLVTRCEQRKHRYRYKATLDVATIFSSSTCRDRGYHEVSSNGDTSHEVYYELHGSTSPVAKRIVFVMGMNASCFAWLKQVNFFVSQGFSILVLDNRGSGNSSVPRGFYGTSDMASDLVSLLDFIGWSGQRSINLIGASLGGMVVLDVARLIPERIATLVLASTKSGPTWLNIPTSNVLATMLRLINVSTQRQGLRLVMNTMFPTSFLDIAGKRAAFEEEFLYRINMSKKTTIGGQIGQFLAVLCHSIPIDALAEIARKIPKIALIAGDQDTIVREADSIALHSWLPGSEYKLCKGVGHGLTLQVAEEFNSWLLRVIEEGEALCDRRS